MTEPRQTLLAYCRDLEARKNLGVVLCVKTDRRTSGIVCCDEATDTEWIAGLVELALAGAACPEGWCGGSGSIMDHGFCPRCKGKGGVGSPLVRIALAVAWATFKKWHPFRPRSEAGQVDAVLKACDAYLENPESPANVDYWTAFLDSDGGGAISSNMVATPLAWWLAVQTLVLHDSMLIPEYAGAGADGAFRYALTSASWTLGFDEVREAVLKEVQSW